MTIKGACGDDDSSRELAEPVIDLNDLLSGFYYQNASFINAVEWMNQNQYHKSILDEAVVEWMGH